MPRCTVSEFRACVLMEVCASSAPMMAFNSSVFRSGELANCSLVLFAACCLSVSDSSSFPFYVHLDADDLGHELWRDFGPKAGVVVSVMFHSESTDSSQGQD